MPEKRRSSSKRPARSRAGGAAPGITVAPRILSSDEKRQLILAHSAMRRPMDPIQRASLWAGVLVCMLFVVGAWAYTVGSGIKKSAAGPLDPELQDVVDNTKKFADDSSGSGSLGEQFKNVTERLNALAEEQAVLDSMIRQLSATTTPAASADRPDLFKPTRTPVTSTTPTP